MKTTSKISLALVASGMAIIGLTAGCADSEPSPPPRVAVVGFVPDYCFWDGYEYVGWYGDDYYYWGPHRTWIICDPIRVQHVKVYVQDHPNWGTRVRPNVQYPVDANGHPHPLRIPPPVRHDRDQGLGHNLGSDHGSAHD